MVRCLPDDVLHLARVRAKDLPVEARILELDPPAQVGRQLLGHRLRPSDEACALAGSRSK